MGNMPGYGDSATWGPVVSPRDPRYDEQAEEAAQDALELALMDVEYLVAETRKVLTTKGIDAARAEFAKIKEVSE